VEKAIAKTLEELRPAFAVIAASLIIANACIPLISSHETRPRGEMRKSQLGVFEHSAAPFWLLQPSVHF